MKAWLISLCGNRSSGIPEGYGLLYDAGGVQVVDADDVEILVKI